VREADGRRSVALGDLVHIGKATNRLEEVEQGLVHDWDEVQLILRDPCEHREASTSRGSELRHVPGRYIECSVKLSSARQMYCSPACRQRAYRLRRNASR
jgi:hypothetical protein